MYPYGTGQTQPYPQQYPAPVQFAPPQQYPQSYPPAPQAYPAPQPAAPAAPLAAGSLDGFYGQPSTGGGKAWSFHNTPNGTTYVGVVSRPITDADIQQQTDMTTKQPRFYRDGRPMFVMIVPLNVQPSAEFPDGVASWWVRGQARDELVRAMAEAGVTGAPEAGAMVQVTKVSERPGKPGFQPSYQYRVVYTRPAGAGAPAPAPQPAPVAPQQYPTVPLAADPAVVAQPQQWQQPAPQQYAPGAPVPGQPAQPYVVQPGQTVQPGWGQQSTYAPSPAGQVPVTVAIPPAAQLNPAPQPMGLGNLTAEQAALMATLTGQPQQ